MTAYANASLGCVGFTIAMQTVFAFLQYRKHGKLQSASMMLLALTGLLPIYEAFGIFVGREKSKFDLLEPAEMFAILKACEIVCESLPEAMIQWGSIILMEPELISDVQIYSLAFTFVAAGLLFMEANASIERSKYSNA